MFCKIFIEMNDITSIYFVILVLLLSTVRSPAQTPAQDIKDLGIAGCKYWGLLQDRCNQPDAPIEKLPKSCTSLIYEGVRIDANNQVQDYLTNGGAILDQLIATTTKVIMFFGYNTPDWSKALNSDNVRAVAKEVMQNLKLYVDQHKGIKGFIFMNLEGQENYKVTGNIKIYIDEMRLTFPDLAIGMNMESDQLLLYLIEPSAKWLDFSILTPSLDFFVLDLQNLNNCTDATVKTGTFPLFKDKNMTSIDALVQYLKGVGIPLSKLYYHYQIYGVTNDRDCEQYYPSGVYAKLYGKGFVATIDVDDFDSICECDRPFPAFNALLDGYNDGEMPTPCPLFDRT